MSLGLAFAVVTLGIVAVLLFVLVAPGEGRVLAAGRLKLVLLTGAVALAVWQIVAAETPFGLGNGVVPDVRGEDCGALTRLEERGLRWREEGRDISSRAPASDSCDREAHPMDIDNPIVRQRPKPGTKLGEGDVVVLIRDCRPLPAPRRGDGGGGAGSSVSCAPD